MLALFSNAHTTYYAQNYAGIIYLPLEMTEVMIEGKEFQRVQWFLETERIIKLVGSSLYTFIYWLTVGDGYAC